MYVCLLKSDCIMSFWCENVVFWFCLFYCSKKVKLRYMWFCLMCIAVKFLLPCLALSCELNVVAISYCCLFCDDVNR